MQELFFCMIITFFLNQHVKIIPLSDNLEVSFINFYSEISIYLFVFYSQSV